MGERYLVTGVQLGLLTSTLNEQARKEIVDIIIDKQYVCNTDNTNVAKDAEKISDLWFGRLRFKLDNKTVELRYCSLENLFKLQRQLGMAIENKLKSGEK